MKHHFLATKALFSVFAEASPDLSDELLSRFRASEIDTNLVSILSRDLLEGLEITNAIIRLCPPGSWVDPPTNVALKVSCEDAKSFGRETERYTLGIPDSENYSVLALSTNGPYPKFEYQIRSDGGLKTFGGMLSRHRGFYVITNTWVYDH